MKKITVNQLVNLLSAISVETPARIVTETEVKMKKTNNPYFGQVTKRTTSNVLLCFNYENEVNRERAKEGKEFDFEAKARTWGDKLGNSPIITNNGQLYLSVRFLKSDGSEFKHNNQPIAKTMLTEWLQESKSSASNQGLTDTNEVIVRTYKVVNVKEITIGTETYVID